MIISTEHFQLHKTRYEALALTCYFGVNAGINATSVLMEESRKAVAAFEAWEPFVWEYSSAFASLLVIPIIAWFMRQYPWQWDASQKSAVRYVMAAIIYCVFHICAMVALRELIYLPSPSNYQFAATAQQLFFEIVYEARKDLWSFVSFIAVITLYRFAVIQWLGDTTGVNISEAPSTENTSLANTLLVKKLGKEFLVKTKDIEWVEACGNYANLHINEEIHPMRITMTAFVDKSAEFGFIRVHKSFAVNVNYVNFIEALPSGDSEITMQLGNKIRLSRRYKVDFEASIAALL